MTSTPANMYIRDNVRLIYYHPVYHRNLRPRIKKTNLMNSGGKINLTLQGDKLSSGIGNFQLNGSATVNTKVHCPHFIRRALLKMLL